MPRLGQNRRTFCRRVTTAAALGAYLLASLGVPLPVPTPAKAGGVPFMCQGSACGCATAEQCWTSCCCHTPEERFAWAAERGVAPPAYATPPAAGWRWARVRDREAPAKSCCDKSCDAPPAAAKKPLPGVNPLRCRGLTVFAALAAVGSVPPAPAAIPAPLPAGTLGMTDESASPTSPPPAVPPPRSAVS